MPELPEVETTRRGLLPHLKGKTVTNSELRETRLRWPVPTDLPQRLKNNKLVNIERRGKYLIFYLKTGHMLCHLGMSGSLRIENKPKNFKKHDHIIIHFQDKTLIFNDPRRFGCLLWSDNNITGHKLLQSLGPEPFWPEFTGQYLWEKARKRQIPIKSFIMENKIVVGVGNIYANEALFLSSIRPTCKAHKVSLANMNKLKDNIIKVLELAITQGGTTLKDFINSDGKPGYFQQQLKVYDRAGQDCLVCGSTIKSIIIAGRNSFYCSNCQ